MSASSPLSVHFHTSYSPLPLRFHFFCSLLPKFYVNWRKIYGTTLNYYYRVGKFGISYKSKFQGKY